MAEPLNFRPAFNGFNREDVVHYIEFLKSNYNNQIRQLQADLAAAQKENLLQDGNQNHAERTEQFAQQEALLTALNAEKEELLARCIMHETDHLDGRLYIDVADYMYEPEEEERVSPRLRKHARKRER